jgi:single-strand DNA-binding protein
MKNSEGSSTAQHQTDRNEVHLAGKIANSPVVRYTASSKAVANLSVATSYQKSTEYHRVVCWEQLAEKCAQLREGDFVRIVGRLQTRSWEDKQTGLKKSATEVVAFQLVIPSEEHASKSGTAAARSILAPPTNLF